VSRLHQVVEVRGTGRARVTDLDGDPHEVSLLAYDGPDLAEGDWVVVHTGFVLSRADEDDAVAALAEWRGAGAAAPVALSEEEGP
jgi:hydrogenase maturation factor